MHNIAHHLFTELHWYQAFLAFTILSVMLVIVLAISLFIRCKSGNSLVSNNKTLLISKSKFTRKAGELECREGEQNSNALADTVFVVPDISGYTKFLSLSNFAFDHGQHIVFELLNSIILAVQDNLRLSKLEGDAVLFFQSSPQISAVELGKVIRNIYRAFYVRRNNLIKSNLCLCKACRNIQSLNLKVFVHEGQASYFQFRDATDVYGSDAIIVHRLMKNTVPFQKYLLVTEPAAGRLEVPFATAPRKLTQDIEDVGRMGIHVYEIDDALVSDFIAEEFVQSGDRLGELIGKFRANIGSMLKLA